MDEHARNEAIFLRTMSSEEAASWLLGKYPDGGQGLRLLRHRSWRRPEQARLADYYLQRMPFAAGWPYEALLAVMSVPRFLKAVEAHFPEDANDVRLALYYLRPALRDAAKSDRDHALIKSFLMSKAFP